MKATVILGFDMGHRLPNHGGACRNLHGHRYTVELTIEGTGPSKVFGASDEGMLADFSDIKKQAKAFVDAELDHRFMIYAHDPLAEAMLELPGINVVDFVPTAENIAAYMFKVLRAENAMVSALRLYETPTSFVDVDWQEAQRR